MSNAQIDELVRPRAGERRGRRQADRRGRRRVPDVLRRGQGATAPGDARGRASGSALPVRLRRDGRRDAVLMKAEQPAAARFFRSRSSRVASPRACVRSRRRSRRRWSTSTGARSSRGSSIGCVGKASAHVVVCVGYLGERIRAVVGDGGAFGLRVEWVVRRSDAARHGGRAQARPAAARWTVLRALRRFVPADCVAAGSGHVPRGKPSRRS